MPSISIKFGPKSIRFNLKVNSISVEKLVEFAKKASKCDKQIQHMFEKYLCYLKEGTIVGGTMIWVRILPGEIVQVEPSATIKGMFETSLFECDVDDEWYDAYAGDESSDDDEPSDEHTHGASTATCSRSNVGADCGNKCSKRGAEREDGLGIVTEQDDRDIDEEDTAENDEESETEIDEGRAEMSEEQNTGHNGGRKVNHTKFVFKIPKWSPKLNTEIIEGRLYLPENQKAIVEESVWHLVAEHGWSVPQGVFKLFAEGLLKETVEGLNIYKPIAATNANKPYASLASKMSKYIRSQRTQLKERRKKQRLSLNLDDPSTSEASALEQLQILTDVSPEALKQAQEHMDLTFKTRNAMRYPTYKEKLDQNKFLKNPVLFKKDALAHLYNTVSREDFAQKLKSCKEKLGVRNNTPESNDLTFLWQLAQLHKDMLPKNIQPAIVINESVPNTPINISTKAAEAFSLIVFHNDETVTYSAILGHREVLLKCRGQLSVKEILALLMGTYILLQFEASSKNEDFFLFLKFALLGQNVPTTIRKPRNKLMKIISEYLTY